MMKFFFLFQSWKRKWKKREKNTRYHSLETVNTKGWGAYIVSKGIFLFYSIISRIWPYRFQTKRARIDYSEQRSKRSAVIVEFPASPSNG